MTDKLVVRGEERDVREFTGEKYPAPTEVVQVTTPMTLLEMAVRQGADVDKLERLWKLKLEVDADNARKAYTEAMAKFKMCPPDIEKDRHVRFKTDRGITEYKHASLANVTGQINAALSKCGLTAGWTTLQTNGDVKVTCRITHVLGHYEETALTAAIDKSGGKNEIQALGSTISYLERYTILALTGLATREMDDDGKAEEIEYISDQQRSTIVDMINAKGVDEGKFLAHMKSESTEKILAADFARAMNVLKIAKGKVTP